MQDINMEPGWQKVLAPFFETQEFLELRKFIHEEYLTKNIYPKPQNLFRAFWLTPFNEVRVVILGQDPYHGPGQAEGLSFSVPEGVPLPPSLKNIYKEIGSDLGIQKDFSNGHLKSWATQGVFLLNSILTVIANTPASHQKKGWEYFTDHVIQTLSDKHEHLVFILWGNFAKSKKVLIDTDKHLVIESPHPSPFSAHSGFFGSKPFSRCNDYLMKHGNIPIQW